MAAAFAKNHPVAGNKTAGTTLAVSLDTEVPAGNLLVLRTVCDNAATAFKPVISSIGRAAGEVQTWTTGLRGNTSSTTAGQYSVGEMSWIRTSVAWPAGAYTVTFDTSVTQKSGFFQEFTGALSTARTANAIGTYQTTTTASSAGPTTGSTPVVGDLAIGFIWGSNVAAAQAGDTDTTGGSWSTPAGVGTTGGGGTVNNYGIGQYKVITSGAHQTLNNSAAMTAGNGAVLAVLQGAVVTPSTGKVKVWTGSAWVEKPLKVWTGSAWVEKPLKFWNGSSWVLA
jgi:hypothetical protein